MKLRRLLGILLWVVALYATGCIKDPNYSIPAIKDINPEITLFEDGMTLSLNEKYDVRIADMIKPSGILKANPDGTYSLSTEGNAGSSTIAIPEPSITAPEIAPVSFNYTIPSIPVSEVNAKIIDLDKSTAASISVSLPKEIIDVRWADLEGTIAVSASATHDIAYIPEGFRFIFPKGLAISKSGVDESFDVKQIGDNWWCIETTKPIRPASHPSFTVGVKNVDLQDATKSGGSITLSDKISIKGELWAVGQGPVPASSGVVSFSVRASVMKVVKGVVKIKVDSSIPDKAITLDIPAALKDSSVIILNDPKLFVTIRNGSPAVARLSADIRASRKDFEDVVIPISGIIAAEGTTVIEINKTDYPDIVRLISMLPDRINLSNISFSNDGLEEFIEVPTGQKYDIEASYLFDAPLVFDEGSCVRFKWTRTNKTDLSHISGTKIAIGATLTNELELDADVCLTITVNGEEIEHPDIIHVDPASGGTTATTDVIIDIPNSGEDNTFVIGDIFLDTMVSARRDRTHINQRQGLSIELNRLYLTEGITTQIQ